MDESLPADEVVRFQGFELNLRTGELRKSGTRIRLQDQPFKVLAALLERPGQLVTREELRKRIWPEENLGDFDHAINLAVTKLRGTLGDSADVPHLIETLPRRGYRFIVPIEKAASDRSQQPVAIAKENIRGKRSGWLAASGGILVVLAGILIWRSSEKVPEELASRVEIVPLAGGPGNEYTPAFSPDGKQVAFAVKGKNDSGIYTTLVGGEKPLRLSSGPSSCCPTWSPDGKEVAFLRFTGRD
jgi:DNA-binding winged helix-turn-helix (wHTH) protein